MIGIGAAAKLKIYYPLAACFPHTVIWCFLYDFGYGNMFVRAQKTASRLIKEEPERFYMPAGNGIVANQAEYDKVVFGKVPLEEIVAPKKENSDAACPISGESNSEGKCPFPWFSKKK